MARFKVVVSETLTHTYEIEAESREDIEDFGIEFGTKPKETKCLDYSITDIDEIRVNLDESPERRLGQHYD